MVRKVITHENPAKIGGVFNLYCQITQMSNSKGPGNPGGLDIPGAGERDRTLNPQLGKLREGYFSGFLKVLL